MAGPPGHHRSLAGGGSFRFLLANAQKCIYWKEESLIPEEIPEQYYDLDDNQMPYGGATDIHGKILWKVSKEEHDQMMFRIKKAFGKE